MSDGDLFAQGVRLFNAGEFYECHEVWEELWTPLRGPRRFFVQSLIHFAVAFYHHQQSNPAGAERQLRKGLRKLAAYLPEYEGVQTGRLYREGVECLEDIVAGAKLRRYPLIAFTAAPHDRGL